MIKNKERRQKGNDKKANEDCFNVIFANIKKTITVAIMILMAIILTIAGKKT